MQPITPCIPALTMFDDTLNLSYAVSHAYDGPIYGITLVSEFDETNSCTCLDVYEHQMPMLKQMQISPSQFNINGVVYTAEQKFMVLPSGQKQYLNAKT